MKIIVYYDSDGCAYATDISNRKDVIEFFSKSLEYPDYQILNEDDWLKLIQDFSNNQIEIIDIL